MGFPADTPTTTSWKMYTMLNWHELKRVELTEELVANILRRFRDTEWLHLPLSKNLYKKLARMTNKHEIPEVNSPWNWQRALNFTTDVVFDIGAFREAMNISSDLGEENIIHEIVARLALNRSGNTTYLKYYMFFNVKAQEFDYQQGITNADLCYLMDSSTAITRSGTELEAKATQAQIRNCFTMLNVDGSSPTNSDLVHRFRRRFTPEFYPMRFKLRDPIYEQHPHTLTLLLTSVLQDYSASRTSYVEFSVGFNDLTTPWIYQYLVHETIWNAIPGPEWQAKARQRKKMEYKFLIGISRNKVKLPLNGKLRLASSDEALDFLNRFPNMAMSHSFNTEAYSEYEDLRERLTLLFSLLPKHPCAQESGFQSMVVGLDLVSEELGFPYCPFIQDSWLELASKYKLGFRLHCGEGVIREQKGRLARAMYAHMYIMALAIRRICARGLKCRIGHGVAFRDSIAEDLTDEEKSNEIIPASRYYNIPDGVASLTPFLSLIADLLVEVNITSNSYLVQQANPTSLIKVLKHWLLCTDDDGVWAPPPCPHHNHNLQALEYCRAISMGYIDQKDLVKAASWRGFCFDHATPGQHEILKLDDTWTCRFHPLRSHAVFALALSLHDQYIRSDAILPIGLTEFLHSFGYYGGFTKFAKIIAPLAKDILNPRGFLDFNSSDHRVKYFLTLLKPGGSTCGLLRSLFLAYDKCLRTIWYETDVWRLCGEERNFPVPPLMPVRCKVTDYKQRRRIAAAVLDATKAAFRQILKWIEGFWNAEKDANVKQWMQSRLALIYERGRSEMEYGQPRDANQGSEDGNRQDQCSCKALHEVTFDINKLWEWTDDKNDDWETIISSSEIIADVTGLVFLDAKQVQKRPWLFNIIWNTQDWYIRPLPPNFSEKCQHLLAAGVDQYHMNVTLDDGIPIVWYNAALTIAKRLFNPAIDKSKNAQKNPDIIRIAGVGFSGSAIAVLVGALIATELRHREVINQKPFANEVIVWAYGGRQFGSKSFHRKVHDLCSYNLEITQWLSLQDFEGSNEDHHDELFKAPFCIQKNIVVYPKGQPMIMSYDLRPSWHYFTLMLHHLPACMKFRGEVDKPNEMSIFFAEDEQALESLAYSIYFPEKTLVCKHEGMAVDVKFGQDAKYQPIIKSIPIKDIRIPPYVWKYNPQQHKTWKDIFHLAPVQTTMRFLGDLLLPILSLPQHTFISLPAKHCDIVNFITMSSDDIKSLSDMKMPPNLKKALKFMNLKARRERYAEEFCLLILGVTRTHGEVDIKKIQYQLEEDFSTPIRPFSDVESTLVTNIEILLIILRNNAICNPFLHYILDQLDCLKTESNFKEEIPKLLLYGTVREQVIWPLKNEHDTKKVYAKYKKQFDKAPSGSYKSFDLALSLHYIQNDEESKKIFVSAYLRRLWRSTDWLSRRIGQKEIVGEKWKKRKMHAEKKKEFLRDLIDDPEHDCIIKVEEAKLKLLENDDIIAAAAWKSIKDTVDKWFSIENRKHNDLLADTICQYGESQIGKLSPSERASVKARCIELSEILEHKDDALYIYASLCHLIGLLSDNNKSCDYYEQAATTFASLWDSAVQRGLDRFLVALNAARCFAKRGHHGTAIAWIGHYFEERDGTTDPTTKKVTLDWIGRELNEGDLNVLALKQVIEPWFEFIEQSEAEQA
jgi:hypothetical protein